MASGIEQSKIPSTIIIYQISVNKTGVRQRDRFAREAAVVPSILLSNTMSPIPKIDEIADTVDTIKPDIAVFTERTLPDEIVNIPTLRVGTPTRDRANRPHGKYW